MRRNPYLPCLEMRDPDAALTLFCLPHGGGSATVYRDWRAIFPAWVDVQPVELPGRGSLLSRPAVTDMDLLVTTVARAVLPAVDRPFAVFGHSMGATVAAELTSWLCRYGHPAPGLMIASGRAAVPDLRLAAATAALPDDELLTWLLGLGGTEPAAFLDPQLTSIALRALRADLTACVGYEKTFDRLPVPILALGGDDDPGVPVAELERWNEQTSKAFRSVVLPGGHFYYRDQMSTVARLITAELRLVPGVGTLAGEHRGG
ncbi:thioesterase II family protein [Micromonospora sp. NPDC049048]|uniref:thioesterase II family protein n=1 Tax=Micromonospora sp. NPDC049048 TaxID=3364263 RepID=UPI003713E82B